MHELSYAQSITEKIIQVARTEEASEIVSVSVAIGVVSGINKECLEFCFPIATENSLAHLTKLNIQVIPVTIYCAKCDQISYPDNSNIRCLCGNYFVDIIDGKECKIIEIEVN